jgi:ATP-dependent RNA helicase DeaD
LAPAPLKTQGDKILPPTEAPAHPKRADFKPPAKAKHAPPTPPNQTRLFMNIGAEMQITPIDIVNAIAGETGLPGKVVGTVDIRERHSFVDVAAEHARAIIARLNRAQIKGHKTKVKEA